MKKHLIPTLAIGLLAALAAPRVDAGVDIDFRLELGWRAEYQHDFDAAVILYEYSGYRGRRLVLYPGEDLDDFYDYEWGFRVRSVEVIGPVHVVLFDESGLWGHQLSIYRNAGDLGDYQMRLNDYSTFRWHRRARSAYVSFNAPDFHVSVDIGPRIFPRLYCSTRVIPHFYDPWPNYRYRYPRPTWHYDRYRRHVPMPPPHPRQYRPDRGNPGITPPPRHATRPPTPPPNMGRPPSTRPPAVPPSRGNSIGRPPSRPPTPPPARASRDDRSPNQPPTSPPRRTPPPRTQPSRDTPGTPPSTRPPNNRPQNTHTAPPVTRPPKRSSSETTATTNRKQNNPPPRTSPPPRRAPPRVNPPTRSSTPPRRSPPPPPRRH